MSGLSYKAIAGWSNKQIFAQFYDRLIQNDFFN